LKDALNGEKITFWVNLYCVPGLLLSYAILAGLIQVIVSNSERSFSHIRPGLFDKALMLYDTLKAPVIVST
jgi:hypothetical protein